MKTYVLVLLIIILVLIIVFVILGRIMFKIAYHPRRRFDKLSEKFLQERFGKEDYIDVLNFEKNTPYQKIEIKSFDNLKLGARLYQNKNKILVIILHGFETNIRTNLDIIKFYYEKSFDVLGVSMRAHLDSEGDTISYGHLERRDLRDWIEYVLSNYPEYESIVIHGFSLGAATALRVSDVEYPKLKLIISDCGFSTSTKAVRFSFYTDGYWYLPFYPIYFVSLMFNYFHSKANVLKSKPINHVKNSKYPILFIQSRQDSFISYKLAKNLYDSCNNTKELIYFNAPHILAFRDNKEEYSKAVLKFIKNNINN